MLICPKIYVDKEENTPLTKYINSEHRAEIQMANQKDVPSRKGYDVAGTVDFAMEQFPDIKTLIVHLPLNDCYLEIIAAINPERLLEEMVSAVSAADKYDIDLYLLYHTAVMHDAVCRTLEDTLYKMLSIIKRRRITILVENAVFYPGKILPNLVLCNEFLQPQLKACVDTTHIKCQAKMYDTAPHQFMEEQLSHFESNELNSIVKVIHFAQATENDGYIDKKTHGRRHENFDELKKDVDILEQCGIKDAIYVTEVSEDDYYSRVDQIWEIESLMKI